MTKRSTRLVFGLTLALIAACSSSSSRTSFTESSTSGAGGDAGSFAPPQLGGERKATRRITLTGRVFAPNGSLPVSNALVYVTSETPAPIPDGAYCDTCVALPEGSFAVSAPDGSFSLTTDLGDGAYSVVVQKGQFRRVRSITVKADGTIALDKATTTLPSRRNPSQGDNTPKMAILKDSFDFDQIDASLKKLGVDDLEVFSDRSLLESPEDLAKYHIVFVPCGSKTPPQVTNPAVQENIRQFVASGGKFYVTDWSYEFVRQPFPGYLSWEAETSAIGSAATLSEWDAPASATDQGLGDWLAATGSSSFTVTGNWTTILGTNTITGPDPKGKPIDITPKTWITAQKSGSGPRATTVSFEHQCGRVLFSTYHTENDSGFGSTLEAQEKALLYVLLEVGVCVGERPQPK